MIKRALFAALAAVIAAASGGAAHAQSFLATPSAPWAGPYVGLHGGYGWDPDIVDTVGELQVNKTATANGVRPPFLSETRRGYMAGGQIGWNVQRGMFVAGVEADASITDLSNKSTYSIPVRFGQAEQGRKTRLYDRTNYIGTARARLGIANGPLLIYGTGGYAYSQVHNDGIFDSSQLTHLDYEGHSSTNLTGWVAGGGVEYLLPGGFRSQVVGNDMDDTTRRDFALVMVMVTVVATWWWCV